MLGIEPLLLLQCGAGGGCHGLRGRHSKDRDIKAWKACSRVRDTQGGGGGGGNAQVGGDERQAARRAWTGWMRFGRGEGGAGEETATGDADAENGGVPLQGMYSVEGVNRLFAVYRSRQRMLRWDGNTIP